jgi:hypothetical protein
MKKGELYLYPKDKSIKDSWNPFVIKITGPTPKLKFYWDFEIVAGEHHNEWMNFAEGSAFTNHLVKITKESQRYIIGLIFKGRYG